MINLILHQNGQTGLNIKILIKINIILISITKNQIDLFQQYIESKYFLNQQADLLNQV